jgi:hypothetical protein
MNTLPELIKTHHSQIVYATGILLAIINLSIKLALNLHPLTDWVALAQTKPRLAALIRLSEALGINPISALQSLIDFFRKEASPGTLAAAKAIGVSAATPLIAPKGAVSKSLAYSAGATCGGAKIYDKDEELLKKKLLDEAVKYEGKDANDLINAAIAYGYAKRTVDKL